MAGEKNKVVKNGDNVEVFYTGTLDDGSVFDSNFGGEPLKFKVGSGEMISGFDKGVVGMKLGEEKSVHIPASEAYGERHEELVVDIPKENFGGAAVKAGMGVSSGDGRQGVVLAVGERSIKVDFNPQLAGKDLNFKIKVAKITNG